MNGASGGSERRFGPVVLAGPSGTGKTTLARALAADCERFVFSVSATTRPPRRGERDGIDYEFVSRADFERMIRAGELVEWAAVHDHLYGTPLRNVTRRDGRTVLLDIDVQGAAQVRAHAESAITVFILPPSAEVLFRRLSSRDTERREQIAGRLRVACAELREAPKFDHIVVNDDLEVAVKAVRALARGRGAPSARTSSVPGEVERLIRGLEGILEGNSSSRAPGSFFPEQDSASPDLPPGGILEE